MLEVGTTDGPRTKIAADAQTALDQLFASMDENYQPVSLAPAPLELGRDNVDMRIDLAKNLWRFRAGYEGRYNVGAGAGGAGAIDPYVEVKSEHINADVTFHDAHWSKYWALQAQLSLLHTKQEFESLAHIFPEGADFTLLGGSAFPEGVLGAPGIRERHYRAKVSGFYKGFRDHYVHLGLGWTHSDLYEVSDGRNFLINDFGLPVSHPQGTVNTGGTAEAFMPEKRRDAFYLFVQDEWALAPNWDLTTGVRYDRYSDFGSTINPRLAVVWKNSAHLTSKLLYGRAFRAPAFAELYSQNNPVALGNKKLDPETIDTVELAWNYRPNSQWQGRLSLFTYEIEDGVQLVRDPEPLTSSTNQNVGLQRGKGFEIEALWQVNTRLSVSGNYAYQRAINERDDGDAGNYPRQQLYLRGDWRFSKNWQGSLQGNWVADRKRIVGDNRPDIDDYQIFDLTVRRIAKTSPWGMTFSIRNLFDKEAYEPSSTLSRIPSDLPLPGRSGYVEFEYHF